MVENVEINPKNNWKWLLLRLMAIFLFLLFIGLAFYEFQESFSLLLISYALLFALPFCLGAIATFLQRPNGENNEPYYELAPGFIIILVLLCGGIFMREGAVCLIMLGPIWLLSGFIGSRVMKKLQQAVNKRIKIYSSSFLVLPFVILSLEGTEISDPSEYVVKRSITIEANVDEVWPHLLSMENITEEEGRWNFTQDILGIPRPTSAIVTGNGVGAWRSAKWEGGVSFEEHIINWEENNILRWNFVFPNDSVQKYTDRHISPDGQYLKVVEGGYTLEAINETQTKLTLDTIYIASTPINTYSAFWGEIILGDIQNNILEIVKNRSE